MHISIPESEEIVEEVAGSKLPNKYVMYNIHINGTYHCSARYSTLKQLNDKLKREFGAGTLEAFPSKSLFYVKPEQAHLRRWQLQTWIQKIASQPLLLNSETFQTFLLNAQKEVQRGPEEEVQVEVFLVNGKSVKVDIISTDQTDDVLETTCSVIGLNPELTYYFALFLVEDASGRNIVRRLQDFESPHISLTRADEGNVIQLRRAYWSPALDAKLYGDATALNLLYIQTIADIKNGWISVDDTVADELASYRASKDRLAFLRVASRLEGYGFTNFGQVTINIPEDGNTGVVSIGQGVLLVVPSSGKRQVYAIQRMRCWRTYSTDTGVEMEFEYYFDPPTKGAEGKMSWVQIKGCNTIYLAMCLQNMVEELLRIKEGKPLKTPSDRVGKFKPRRQTNKDVDLSFLTDDSSAPNTPGPDKDSLQYKLGLAKPKVAVTLSDLKARVSEQDDDDDSEWNDTAGGAASARAMPLSSGGTTSLKADPDDYDSDDDKKMFASFAGL